MLEQIADPANLAAAWMKVRANAGASGVDGQTVTAFAADAEGQLAGLRRRLLSAERYVPPPVRRVQIPKPDGRIRPLGIPTVGDRVVQQATVQVIGPLFERRFLSCSFGYRPRKGAQQAVMWVHEAIRRGDRWVAEFDIVGFFDNLRHNRLLREVAKEVDDVEVIGLVRRWLKAGVLTDKGQQARTAGTPQGGVISPLLANIYLHRLDVELRAAGHRLIRYADDFVILADRRWKVEAADRLVRHVLADIGLDVAEAKSAIVDVEDGFEFLGFRIYGKYLQPRDRSLREFKKRIRALSLRHTSESVPSIIAKLNPVIRGWGNYHAIGHVKELYRTLDHQIRTRLRSHVLKWHANRYNGTLPNKTLQRLGLVSLVDIYQSRTSPVTGLHLG